MSRLLKLCIVIGVCILLSSIAVNIFLFKKLMGAFGEVHYARNFPLGFIPREESKYNSSDPVEVAVYGDSRAYSWGKYLRRHSKLQVENMASGSITSSQLRLQLQTEPPVYSRWAVIQIGINDLHPLGAISPYKKKVIEELEKNLPIIVEKLRERSQWVVLTTIFPPHKVQLDRRPFWDSQTLDLIQKANELIGHIAQLERVTVLHTASILGGESRLISEKYVDPDFFLHVNEEAYQILTDELVKHLSEIPMRNISNHETENM